MGVGLNLIVCDGGIWGVVIWLGWGFNIIQIDGDIVIVGVVVLDVYVVCKVVEVGCDLIFLCIIFGSIGGVVCMNVGCYGIYVVDYLILVWVVMCGGQVVEILVVDLCLSYCYVEIFEGWVIIEVCFCVEVGDFVDLVVKMDDQFQCCDVS